MYLINADFLELRYTCPGVDPSDSIIYLNSKIKLVKTTNYKYHNKEYKNCYDIILNDIHSGFLYTKPDRNPYYIDKKMITLRVKDTIFYNQKISELVSEFTTGMKAYFSVEMTLHGISRLDICYDSDVDLFMQFQTWYYDKERYSFKNRKKLKVNGTGPDDNFTTIGSLKSREKTIIIYNKTNQMQIKEKPFLSDLYLSLFGTDSVCRAEIKLFSRETRKLNIDLMQLDDKNYLEGIFKTILR